MQVHIAASDCLLDMTQQYSNLPSMHWTDIQFKDELFHQYEMEKNGQAKSLLKKCIDILESLTKEQVETA